MFFAKKLYITDKKYLKRCPYCNSKVVKQDKEYMKPSFVCSNWNCMTKYYEREYLPKDYDDRNVVFVHLGVFAALFQGSIDIAYDYFTREYHCERCGEHINLDDYNLEEIFTVENISYLMNFRINSGFNGWSENVTKIIINWYDRENILVDNRIRIINGEQSLMTSKLFSFLYKILKESD